MRDEMNLIRTCAPGENQPTAPLACSAWLMRHPLATQTTLRFAFGLTGGVLAPALTLVNISLAPVCALISITLLVLGEITERTLFFQSMAALRMPSNPTH